MWLTLFLPLDFYFDHDYGNLNEQFRGQTTSRRKNISFAAWDTRSYDDKRFNLSHNYGVKGHDKIQKTQLQNVQRIWCVMDLWDRYFVVLDMFLWYHEPCMMRWTTSSELRHRYITITFFDMGCTIWRLVVYEWSILVSINRPARYM